MTNEIIEAVLATAADIVLIAAISGGLVLGRVVGAIGVICIIFI